MWAISGSSFLFQDPEGFSHAINDGDAVIQFDDGEDLMDERNRSNEHQPLALSCRFSIAVFEHTHATHIEIFEFMAIDDNGTVQPNKSQEVLPEERGR
jgi:hypothetical protein